MNENAYPLSHPKLQIERRIHELERQLRELKEEDKILQRAIGDREYELNIWKEWLDIVRTYQITDEVRERLIRTQTLRIDPPID